MSPVAHDSDNPVVMKADLPGPWFLSKKRFEMRQLVALPIPMTLGDHTKGRTECGKKLAAPLQLARLTRCNEGYSNTRAVKVRDHHEAPDYR